LSNTVPKDRVCQKKALHFSSIRTESADVLNTPNFKTIQGKRIRPGCCTFATTYFGLTVNLSKNLILALRMSDSLDRRKQTLYSFEFGCQPVRINNLKFFLICRPERFEADHFAWKRRPPPDQRQTSLLTFYCCFICY
jgi:hypothetical protein